MYLGINHHDAMDVWRCLGDAAWEIVPLAELRVGDVLSGAVIGSFDAEGWPRDTYDNNGFDGSPYRNRKTGEIEAHILRRDLLKPDHHAGVVEFMKDRD